MKNKFIYKTSLSSFDIFSAKFIFQKLREISEKKNVVNVALSGGSTPLPVLHELTKFPLPWGKFNFFLVDERNVAIDSSENNFYNVNQVFFQHVNSNCFPVIFENKNLEENVSNYKTKIKEKLEFDNFNTPKFDLILLGMGLDGHTASLFPDTDALYENKEFLTSNYVSLLGSERITLTFPVLQAANQLIVLIKGKDKLNIFERIMNGSGTEFPISKLIKRNMSWIIGV